MKNIKKGQHVKIINTGKFYTTYYEMAIILGIDIDNVNDNVNMLIYDKFKEYDNYKNENGIVLNFHPHLKNLDIIIVAVYLQKFDQTIMIGSKGLTILPDPVILPDNLFEI